LSPTLKYTLGRIGLFLLVLLVLWPVNLNVFVKLMLAVVFSAALAFFLLRRWRDEMVGRLATTAARRKADRDQLRSALAGEDRAGEDRAGEDRDGTRAERHESGGEPPKG
jgi:hypothetical protein